MGRLAPTIGMLLVAGVGAAGLAVAAIPDLALVAGQSAQGEIAFAGEEDRVAVRLLKGQKLTFTAKPAKKSLLQPNTDVYDAAGAVQTVPAKQHPTKKTSSAVNAWPIPATGTYLLGVRGAVAGPTGVYDLTTKATAAAQPKFPAGSFDAANEIDELSFDAAAGTKATLTLKRGKGGKAVPHVVSILAPDGNPVSLVGVVRKSVDTLDLLKSVPLPQFGTYKVRVQGLNGTVGGYQLLVSLKAPAVPKGKLDFRGASGGEATAGVVTSIEIAPASPTLAVGKTVQLLAMATYADGRVRDATRAVTWGSRNPAVATVADGSSPAAGPGLATGVAAGGAVVQAWTGAVEARETLVLVGGATVTGVTIVPAAPVVARGDSISLQATATISTGDPVDATSAATWAAAGGVSVTVAGPRVTAGTASGVAQITASLGGVAGAARDVTVVGRRLERIAVAPAYKELPIGSAAFTATATFSDGTTDDVTATATWTCDNAAAASLSGATATFVAAGTAGIRATLDGVSSRPAVLNCGPTLLQTVTVNATASLPKGGTRDFTATGTFIDGGTRDVTEAADWSSDAATNIAVEATAGIRGRATALVASGAATLTASVPTAAGAKKGTAVVNGAASERTSLFIVPRVGTLGVGGAAPFRAIARKSDGSVEDVTLLAGWTTSNSAAATVSGGVVTGVANGGAAIGATMSGMNAQAVALVGAGRVTGLSVQTPSALPLGDSGGASAFAAFAPSAGVDPPARVTTAVAWFSDDPISLPVGADGVASAHRVATTKIGAALATFAAAPQDAFGVAAVERSLTVFPQGAHAIAGADVQLAAQVKSSDGSVVDLAAACGWSSETPSKASVNGTGLVHAVAKGASRITALRTASGVTDTQSFATSLEPPSITSVAANGLVRGTSNNLVTINGAGLDGPGPNVSFAGVGVIAAGAPTPNADGTQATVLVNVAGDAAPGPRDLTYTTTLGFFVKTGAVVVANTPPTIASISPTNIDVPASGSTNTTLVVTGSGFATGDTFALGTLAGVSVSNLQVVNATTMQGTVAVQSGTTKSRIDVTVQQSAGAGGQTATLVQALKIGPADPTVTTFAPTYVQLFPHTVFGQIVGTGFGAGIVVAFPSTTGTVSNLQATRQSATLITFQFDVPNTAAAGIYHLTLQNTGDVARQFNGMLVVAPTDPNPTTFNAPTLARGASSVAVEIGGTNFLAGDGVTASGAGVSFSNVAVVSSEKITANATVAAGATLSTRDVVVAHASLVGGRSGTLRNAFRVTDAAPTVASCNPSRVGRTGAGGPTRRIPIVVTGTNFGVGATASVALTGASGVTVVANSTTVASDTSLTFNIDLAGAATTGNWDVTVTNAGGLGDSGSSGVGKLTVSSETTPTVNRVVASSGSALGGELVTIYGAGFARGLVVDFGTERAPGAQFIDQNTAVCTVPPPANPASGSSASNSRTGTTAVDVKVTNPSSANATLTGGYTYVANNTSFRIAQSYPADSSTNVPQNLRSAVVRLTDYANTTTAVQGSTRGAQCQWFESGGFTLTSQAVGFGADRRFLVFTHPSGGNLPYGQNSTTTPGKYVLETATAVKSAAGAPLVPAKLAQSLNYDQWFFTITTSATDNTSPTVSLVPAFGASGVPTNTTIALTFSKEIDPLTVTSSSITVTPSGGGAVACSISLSSDLKKVTLTPYAELAAGTTFTVAMTGVQDLFGNAAVIIPSFFTTGTGADTTAPTIDSVVFEQIPASMDGSTTYVAGTDTPTSPGAATAFRLYLPKSAWKVTVNYSDAGGAGVDESQFSAKASVASGSTAANTELASKFDVSSTRAVWTVASADALTAGDNATLTFTIKDKAGTPNTSTAKVVTINLIDIAATAVGGGGSPGGDLAPFNTRETWLLRFDRDAYTATLSTNGATQQCVTAAGANGVLDIEEGLRISGLATANMTTDCANTTNGTSVGTNAIVVRLVQERIRATIRARFGIAEDGTRGADSADIEFLLAGEQGSLPAPPVWSASSNGNSGKAFSEMDIGGDTGPNGSPTAYFGTIGFAFYDPRNRLREADINDGGAAGGNLGIFAINMGKAVMNSSLTGTTWGMKVLAKFQTAKGGTPIGEGSLDDDVLAGAYDRTSSAASNTQAMKDRYDQIMDGIEASALSVSSVAAHEIGHSLGLVPDSGPKTGFFGNAYRSNTFTEAVAALPNTTIHLNFLGNDIMSPVSSVDQRTATGTDFMAFAPYDRDYLLQRQVHDEGR